MASMMGYIKMVKRQFRDKYGFIPSQVLEDDEPLFGNIPDGEYPMKLEGIDEVVVISGNSIGFKRELVDKQPKK